MGYPRFVPSLQRVGDEIEPHFEVALATIFAIEIGRAHV